MARVSLPAVGVGPKASWLALLQRSPSQVILFPGTWATSVMPVMPAQQFPGASANSSCSRERPSWNRVEPPGHPCRSSKWPEDKWPEEEKPPISGGSSLQLDLESRLKISGAEGRIRTDTGLPPPVFETGASTIPPLRRAGYSWPLRASGKTLYHLLENISQEKQTELTVQS